MARGTGATDWTTLQMALVGYQIELEKVDARIQEIQSLLKGNRGSLAAGASRASGQRAKKRNLSPEARQRISAAQTKRWAEHRKLKAKAARAQ